MPLTRKQIEVFFPGAEFERVRNRDNIGVGWAIKPRRSLSWVAQHDRRGMLSGWFDTFEEAAEALRNVVS